MITIIALLCTELSMNQIPTDGLKSDALSSLLRDLKAKKKDKDTETAADHALPVGACKVCEGKAVTTLEGMKAEGDTVTVEMISGGQDSFDRLKEIGVIK